MWLWSLVCIARELCRCGGKPVDQEVRECVGYVEVVSLLSGNASRLVQKRLVQASMPWHTRWHTEQGRKEKTPSKSITWGCILAERAGFEPAVGISPHTLSRRAT